MSASRPARPRCSFCRKELEDGSDLSIPPSGAHGRRVPHGLYCSERCRDCVLALAALHPSPLAPADFVERRTLLTDRLLELWRKGKGPDPALVLRAAERVGHGLSFAPFAPPSTT